ncbi:MAG: hypothetical protein AAB519_01165 [Patescibacteria group bacterium]
MVIDENGIPIFDWEKVIIFPDGAQEIGQDYEINPKDFLEFANTDLQEGDDRGLINALSNSKRAIHCVTEKLLSAIDIKPRNNQFPSKMEIFEDLGIIAPRIIRKVNSVRNLLEHEYKLPSKEVVEDAVDIATLYVSVIEGVLETVWSDFYIIENEESKDLGLLEEAVDFSFDKETKSWEAYVFVSRENKKADFEIKGITSSDKELYRSIWRMCFAVDKELQEEKALEEFSKNINLLWDKK